MKIKITEQDDKKLAFTLEDADVTFANAMRRIMMVEVPTLAVEFVDFHENNSAMYDEVVAHRLGLIPLVFDPKMYNFTEECVCEGKGCSQCQVYLVADKKGPCVVYSGDLKSTDENVKPADPGFPIVELLEGQNLKLDAIAQLGKGEAHIKWQAAIAAYKYSKNNDTKFGFIVESVSGLEPAYIVQKAAEIIETKAEQFREQLKEVK
ncbi:MAG: DNA-directed RNA polymerase subunit D [Candidatus Aenigmarchaeota archaeon]|nr:DNA-directed RNA polymerase subunit D [Candidatus Aenigmarchaeota archaeon]